MQTHFSVRTKQEKVTLLIGVDLPETGKPHPTRYVFSGLRRTVSPLNLSGSWHRRGCFQVQFLKVKLCRVLKNKSQAEYQVSAKPIRVRFKYLQNYKASIKYLFYAAFKYQVLKAQLDSNTNKYQVLKN